MLSTQLTEPNLGVIFQNLIIIMAMGTRNFLVPILQIRKNEAKDRESQGTESSPFGRWLGT